MEMQGESDTVRGAVSYDIILMRSTAAAVAAHSANAEHLTNDVQIVSEPRKMMAIASGLVIAGFPKVIEMLKDGDAGHCQLKPSWYALRVGGGRLGIWTREACLLS